MDDHIFITCSVTFYMRSPLYILILKASLYIPRLSNSCKISKIFCVAQTKLDSQLKYISQKLSLNLSSQQPPRAWQLRTPQLQFWSWNLKLNLKNCKICLSSLFPAGLLFYPLKSAGFIRQNLIRQQKLISLSQNGTNAFFME